MTTEQYLSEILDFITNDGRGVIEQGLSNLYMFLGVVSGLLIAVCLVLGMKGRE